MSDAQAYAEVIKQEKQRFQEEQLRFLHMEPPWQLKLTAVIVLWIGVSSALAMISKWIEGTWAMNLAFLYAFGAFGLLRRSPRSIFWVKWTMRITVLFAFLLLFSWMISSFNDLRFLDAQYSPGLSEDGILNWMFPLPFLSVIHVLIGVVLFAWPAFSFSIPAVQLFLGLPELPQNSRTTRSWLGVSAVLLLFTSAFSAWNEDVLRFANANTFTADIAFTVKDSKSGVVIDDYIARLNPIPRLHQDHIPKADEAKLIYNLHREGDTSRKTMTIKGKVVHSAVLVITTGEHETEIVTIDKDTPSELTVELEPLPR